MVNKLLIGPYFCDASRFSHVHITIASLFLVKKSSRVIDPGLPRTWDPLMVSFPFPIAVAISSGILDWAWD